MLFRSAAAARREGLVEAFDPTSGASWTPYWQSAYPAVRDFKAAVRFVRANAAKFGIDPKTATIYRQSGRVQTKNNKIEECRVCRGTGFFGTTGVFEVMPVDREASKLLAGGDLKAAYTHSRRSLDMMLMQEAAVKKVARGETSFEEVARVFATEIGRAHV